MNCNITVEHISDIVAGTLEPRLLASCEKHLNECSDCRDALRAAESLATLSDRNVGATPAGLFDRIVEETVIDASRPRVRGGFWLGTGFGGAVAASLLMLALALGWIGPVPDEDPGIAQFAVAVSEPRNMEIAIETDRALAGANISILLSGNVAIDGYGDRRELAWTTDLKAGVNRLSLPVRAIDATGGQVVVRLDHPDSEQVFVVQLKADV